MRGEYYLDGQHERGVSPGIFLTHQRPQLLIVILQVVDHNVHDLAVALPGGLVQHVLLIVVDSGHVCPVLEQQLDRVVVVVGGGHIERGAELLIQGVNFYPRLTQETFHNPDVASARRIEDKL